jgi:hypothetical protein
MSDTWSLSQSRSHSAQRLHIERCWPFSATFASLLEAAGALAAGPEACSKGYLQGLGQASVAWRKRCSGHVSSCDLPSGGWRLCQVTRWSLCLRPTPPRDLSFFVSHCSRLGLLFIGDPWFDVLLARRQTRSQKAVCSHLCICIAFQFSCNLHSQPR